MGVPVPLHTVDLDGHRHALAHELPQRALVSRRAPVERVAELGRGGHAARVQLAVEDAARHLALRETRLRDRQAPLREIPQPLLTVATDDHDLALAPHQVEHHGDAASPLVVPSARAPGDDRSVLQVARPHRTATTELPQDVATEPCVRGEPLLDVAPTRRPGRRAAVGVAEHRFPVHPEVRGGNDVDPVLEERALGPEHPLEFVHAEPAAEPREEHEVLGPRHGRRGIHLHHPQVVDDVRDGGRAGRGQPLAHNTQAPRLPPREPQGSVHAMQATLPR